MAVGPAMTEYVTQWFSINGLFYFSSGLALLSVLVQGTLTETLPKELRQRFSLRLLRLNWRDEVLEPRVLAPALVTLLCMFPYGAIITLAPDQSRALGLGNKGIFYTYYTLATLFVRLVASRASDRYGRVPVLRISAVLMVAALLLLASATKPWMFLGGAAMYGFSTGLNSPTLYAWTVDLSDPARRGRGVATMYIALEVGIGLGALLAGWLYANDPARISYVHILSAACVFSALVYLFRQPARQVVVG
jgi:MFS family permease